MLIHTMPTEAWHNDAIPLLPPEILADEWVLYHGTSNSYESDIETNGLRSNQASPITKEVVQRVVACFKRLNWYGDDAGGYCVLDPFTAQHDHSYQAGKPIFLGESCRRSLLYATRDFAGGEGCRSLRKALNDLWAYLNDEQVRYDALTKPINETVNGYGEVIYADTPLSVHELDWLNDELIALQPIKQFVDAWFEQYQYGVVYAIKFDERDLSSLFTAGGMGIAHTGTIKPGKIVAKLLTDGNTAYNPFVSDGQQLDMIFAWSDRLQDARTIRTIQIK